MGYKKETYPICLYRENGGISIVSFRKWGMYRGKQGRHTRFYRPTPSSIRRIEKVISKMNRRVNSIDNNIEAYGYEIQDDI